MHQDYTITHLKQLESEAIFILRETAAQFEKPVLLFSGGKDSSFEAPDSGDPDWTITTDNQTEDASLTQLLEKVLPLIKVSKS